MGEWGELAPGFDPDLNQRHRRWLDSDSGELVFNDGLVRRRYPRYPSWYACLIGFLAVLLALAVFYLCYALWDWRGCCKGEKASKNEKKTGLTLAIRGPRAVG